MRARALPVTTNRSQSGEGVPLLLVMISTWSPWLQLGAQLHHAAVDLGADAAVADLGVDGIGEVDRRGARGRAIRSPLGVKQNTWSWNISSLVCSRNSSGPDGMLEDVQSSRIQRYCWPSVIRPLLLVGPVRGDAELGHLVHVAGADLHLDLAPLRADDGGVQRAVAVGLGRADEVLEAPGSMW